MSICMVECVPRDPCVCVCTYPPSTKVHSITWRTGCVRYLYTYIHTYVVRPTLMHLFLGACSVFGSMLRFVGSLKQACTLQYFTPLYAGSTWAIACRAGRNIYTFTLAWPTPAELYRQSRNLWIFEPLLVVLLDQDDIKSQFLDGNACETARSKKLLEGFWATELGAWLGGTAGHTKTILQNGHRIGQGLTPAS